MAEHRPIQRLTAPEIVDAVTRREHHRLGAVTLWTAELPHHLSPDCPHNRHRHTTTKPFTGKRQFAPHKLCSHPACTDVRHHIHRTGHARDAHIAVEAATLINKIRAAPDHYTPTGSKDHADAHIDHWQYGLWKALCAIRQPLNGINQPANIPPIHPELGDLALNELRPKLRGIRAAYLDQWRHLITTDTPHQYQQLADADLPHLRVGTHPNAFTDPDLRSRFGPAPRTRTDTSLLNWAFTDFPAEYFLAHRRLSVLTYHPTWPSRTLRPDLQDNPAKQVFAVLLTDMIQTSSRKPYDVDAITAAWDAANTFH